MSVQATILEEMARIAMRHHKTLAPYSDQLPLLSTGLDSLCIAILVASLYDKLGVDPFDSMDGVPIPVTLHDFIELYEHAAV